MNFVRSAGKAGNRLSEGLTGAIFRGGVATVFYIQ